MESKCIKCIGKWICAGDHLINGGMCKKFHSALESKLHSHNNESFQSLCKSCDESKCTVPAFRKGGYQNCTQYVERSGTKNIS